MKLTKISTLTLLVLGQTLSGLSYADSSLYEQALALKADGKSAEAEAAFSSFIQIEPFNVKAIEQLAVVQSWQQKFDDSIASYRHALDIDSSQTSARAGLARVLYWKGDREAALTEINQVLTEQPSNADYVILKGDILQANNQAREAKDAYLEAKSLLGGQETPALTKKLAYELPKKWRIDAGHVEDTFNVDDGVDEREDGYMTYTQIGYTFDNKTTVYVRGEDYSSFGDEDMGIAVGTYFSPLQSVALNGEFYSNTDTANFRPKQMLTLNADFLFSKTVQPLLGFRQGVYAQSEATGAEDLDDTVTTITPGLRINYGKFSVEYRLALTENLDGSDTSTTQLKAAAYFDNISPYLLYIQGEEGVPPQDIAEIETIGLGAVIRLNQHISARLDYSQQDRKDEYTQNSLGFGVSLFF